METVNLNKRTLEDEDEGAQAKKVHLLSEQDSETAQENMEQIPDDAEKLNGTTRPSRVLLIRHLGKGATEVDVEALVHPFTDGISPKIFLRTATGQAFVELANEAMASSALNFFSQNPIAVKGSMIQASFSKRESVTTHEEKAETFRVLLASVTKMRYNVDIDALHGIFSRFGAVEKIVSFMKTTAMYQALIQFRDAADAKKAMVNLHNRNMYEGCNMLQIQPSRLPEIKVRANDKQKAWDFTIDPMSGPATVPSYIAQPNTEFCPTGLAPGVANAGILGHQQLLGNNQQMYLAQPMQGMPQMQGAPFDMGRMGMPVEQGAGSQQTPVVICYHLSPEDITPQKLFNLFSLYGNVTRIKILRDKPETALIQFLSPADAHLARAHLHETTLYGRKIQVAPSRNSEIKVSSAGVFDGEEQCKRTMEFSQRDQRYKLEEADKYTKSACRPTSTLFVANIAEEGTREDLVKLFSSVGTVTGVEFKTPKSGSKKQMAIVGMGNEEEGLAGLCAFHNYSLNGCGLKIAFSRSVVR